MHTHLLAANRALRSVSAALVTHNPLEAAGLVECASAILPLCRTRTIGIIAAMAYAPQFSGTLLNAAYKCDERLLKIEFVLLSLLLIVAQCLS